jgi:hypothetical protein
MIGKTLILVAPTGWPALANVPFSQNNPDRQPERNPIDLRTAAAWIPSTPGARSGSPSCGSYVFDPRQHRNADYVIAIATIETQDGETKKYTVIQKWVEK